MRQSWSLPLQFPTAGRSHENFDYKKLEKSYADGRVWHFTKDKRQAWAVGIFYDPQVGTPAVAEQFLFGAGAFSLRAHNPRAN